MKFTQWIKEKVDSLEIPRSRGTAFEKICKYYLENDNLHSDIAKVLTWTEFVVQYKAGKSNKGDASEANHKLSQKDTGIDLVAITDNDKYVAIQCKYRSPNKKIYKDDINSFYALLGSHGKLFISSLFIDTTVSAWTPEAENVIENFHNARRIALQDLDKSRIDWDSYFTNKSKSDESKKNLRSYQNKALEKARKHYQRKDKGQLIMACGTGKTFTSLKIVEDLERKFVLFLAPSLSLLHQSIKNWNYDSTKNIHFFAVCSDVEVGKKNKDDEDKSFQSYDLIIPPTTNAKLLAHNVNKKIESIKSTSRDDLVVIFSTYQSIDQINKAQEEYHLPQFDMVICDEAHRTAGFKKKDDDILSDKEKDAAWTWSKKIHKPNFIKSHKWLYMTATPIIYANKTAKNKQELNIYDMSETKYFGEKFYNYGFDQAIKEDVLSDYRIVIFYNEYQNPGSQEEKHEYWKKTKWTMAYKAMCKIQSKNIIDNDQKQLVFDKPRIPLKKMIGFTNTIKDSKLIHREFANIASQYKEGLSDSSQKQKLVNIEIKHIDGTQQNRERETKLFWLKEPSDKIKMITNVNCLSEGIDVPSLDGIIFFAPNSSQIKVVQAVGRILRKAKNKKYGYIIIPITTHKDDKDGTYAKENKKEYRKVISVVNAMMAHDQSLSGEINGYRLNRDPNAKFQESNKISIVSDNNNNNSSEQLQQQIKLNFAFEKNLSTLIIKSCSREGYWKKWSTEVAKIAAANRNKLKDLLDNNPEACSKFTNFIKELKKNISEGVKHENAIDMIIQHQITRPIFNALFKNQFTKNNPVVIALNEVCDYFSDINVGQDNDELNAMYNWVEHETKTFSPEEKQRLIKELYNDFFILAFPDLKETLGIIYTPIEVIDFMIHSVEYLLDKHFHASLNDNHTKIIDPFTGTGSFITRLLMSGIIEQNNLLDKYKHNIYANELVLMAYYIAILNIEQTFLSLTRQYQEFNNISWTDTFQMYEDFYSNKEQGKFFDIKTALDQNYKRIIDQKKVKINVILTNPPYNAGTTANNSNVNTVYPNLDSKCQKDYGRNFKNIYTKALKWAEERLAKEGKGIICFICPSGPIEGDTMKRMRAKWSENFCDIYCFNLLGDIKNQGWGVKSNQGANIFGRNCTAGIIIIALVENISKKLLKANFHYFEIPFFKNHKDKLIYLKQKKSFKFLNWNNPIKINDKNQWINQPNESEKIFEDPNYYLFLNDSKKQSNHIFNSFSVGGVSTNRDNWVINYNPIKLQTNIKSFIQFYNDVLDKYRDHNFLNYREVQKTLTAKETDNTKIKWDRKLHKKLLKKEFLTFKENMIVDIFTRPFTKSFLYFDADLNSEPYKFPYYFPSKNPKQKGIVISHTNIKNSLGILGINHIINSRAIKIGNTKYFALYNNQQKKSEKSSNLFDEQLEQNPTYINEQAIKQFQYGNNKITATDIFYYIYGILHCKSFIASFPNQMIKQLPRISKIKKYSNFIIFKEAGQKLFILHTEYESANIYQETDYNPNKYSDHQFKLTKMQYGKKLDSKTNKKIDDKTKIIYNEHIIIQHIPEKAYEYKLGNKPALDFFMNGYKKNEDKKNHVINNPNDYLEATNKSPRYFVELLLKVINISIQTVNIINALPKIDFTDKNNLEKFKI